MYQELEHSLTLRGTGETREEAFNKVMSQIKPGVVQEFKQMIIRIEPKEFVIVSARETCYTERFLGLFFPRTRTRCEVSAQITVRVGLLDLEKVNFEQMTEETSVLQKILRLG